MDENYNLFGILMVIVIFVLMFGLVVYFFISVSDKLNEVCVYTAKDFNVTCEGLSNNRLFWCSDNNTYYNVQNIRMECHTSEDGMNG